MKKTGIWFGLIFLVALCLLSKYALEIHLYEAMSHKPNLQPGQARYHSDSLKQYNLGFANLIAATIWIQLLQRSTYEQIKEGKVSWEFSQLDAVTSLDRDFERAYSYGAIFLSVFKRDKLGGRLILEKWAKYRPNYWRVHYILGYHLYSEVGDFHEASREILKAAAMEGSPTWLSSLGIRLLSQSGALLQALKLSIELFPGIRDEDGRERLRMRIRSLSYSLQKSAWDHALLHFRKIHKTEPENLEALYPYVGLELREISSLMTVGDVSSELLPILHESFGFYYSPHEKAVVSSKEHADLLLDKTGIYVHDDDKETQDE
jgi:tetratricopeptide (TPR) repeat protein